MDEYWNKSTEKGIKSTEWKNVEIPKHPSFWEEKGPMNSSLRLSFTEILTAEDLVR